MNIHGYKPTGYLQNDETDTFHDVREFRRLDIFSNI